MGGKGMVLSIRDRSDAEKDEYNTILEEATGIFMTGGNQLPFYHSGWNENRNTDPQKNAKGIPVAGTSAGAAFISEHMIAFGQEGSTPCRQGDIGSRTGAEQSCDC